MIKQIRLCDHCGHEIDELSTYYTVTTTTYGGKAVTQTNHDYCATCGLKVLSVLRGKDEEITEIPEGMTVSTFEAEEHAPKPPNKGGRPKKKLDIGKIKALRAAGWTIAKIADEMGESSSVIQRALMQAKREENNE